MPHDGSFRGLRVWRESMLLVEDIYRLSKGFPADERFGLTAQLRRAAISIPSNIGEGGRRKRRKAHIHHLDIALGSQGEVDVQLELARRLAYISSAEYEKVAGRVDNVGKMLNGLIESLQPVDEEWS
jgi:four helix bundle protein